MVTLILTSLNLYVPLALGFRSGFEVDDVMNTLVDDALAIWKTKQSMLTFQLLFSMILILFWILPVLELLFILPCSYFSENPKFSC